MLLASFPRLFARHARTLVTAIVASTAVAFAQTPAAADGFSPDVNGNVFVVTAQPDGKLLIGGLFSAVNGATRNNLARLNADGSLDESFNPNPDGAVRAIVIQADERIVIGGDFSTLQPGGAGAAVNRGRVARLSTAGLVDATFNPNIVTVAGDLQTQVHALLLQPNGQLLVGGSFSTVQPNGGSAATRNNLARFNADGSLDAAFNPNANAAVLALANHVDNKILVGGGFTSFAPSGGAATTRNRIARLNANGTVDSEFNPNANNGVTTLAVQRDGKILLGGFFTTLQPPGDESAANRAHFARLNVNGTIDSEFYPRAEGNVSALAVHSDGTILIGGTFAAVWGRGSASVARNFLARFNYDGSVDPDFAPTVNAEVKAFAFQPDGKVVIGGNFTRAQLPGATTALVRNHIARLNADGSLDSTFALDAGGRILVSITQTDGRVVIGGTFTSVGGATHNYLARLNADGTIDPTYNPDFNGRVYTLAYDATANKVLVGGAFTTINGESRNYIARLNPNGTIDSEFNPNVDGQVGVIVLQANNSILVGGTFSSAQPIGTATRTGRSNLLRLNANGTLDTAFDPSPNSSVSAIAVQSDGKILIGGLFSALTPGFAANTSAATTTRAFLARVNSDGTLDTAFAPNLNGQVSAIAVQSDGKIVVGGAFTAVAAASATESTTRNRIARFNADGTIDTAYDPNANGNVLALALQSDGRLLVGGSFTTFTPNGASDWTLRKYAARLNTDGTVDASFNLDLNEEPGNRIDSIRIQPDGRVFLGGNFRSLQPSGSAARTSRLNFARLAANGSVDLTFDPGTGGSTGAIVNGFALQPDGKIIAVGSFADLGGAKSTNIARFRAEGTPDPEFSSSLTTDGPINAVVIRPNGAPAPSQLSGFAWLNANGTLRGAFAASTRLSGEVNSMAVDGSGRLLLGGAFANLSNTTAGNLVRFTAAGAIDASFNPAPNGAVTGIAVQADGRIIIVGTFTTVGGVVRNRIARIDANGSLDTTYDPNANARINAVVLQGDGQAVVGGAFTSFTPNLAATAVTRNYLARIGTDGSVDANYNPTANFTVNALALQGDGKVIAGGAFTTVQPNSGTTAFARNGIARFNTDGTVDQNFDPNANSQVNAVVALPNGQILLGGSFTTLQPTIGGTLTSVVTRSNLARINSDGAVDTAFNPNPNAAVSSLAVQTDGQILVGGAFTTVQPGATGVAVARNHLARLTANGALDLDFNPDVNGSVTTVLARPDGTVLVGGNFTDLQLNGSILVGGNFATVGGVAARNLAMLNDNGSVNATFQPRPDGAVNALLVQADGKVVVGGAFANISGAARSRLARFNGDGSLDTGFAGASDSTVLALALQPDGKILVGGAAPAPIRRLNADGSIDASFNVTEEVTSVRALAVQPDGRILFLTSTNAATPSDYIGRWNANGSRDASFGLSAAGGATMRTFTLQTDGRVVVAGSFSQIGNVGFANIARLHSDGAIDSSFNPTPNGRVTAVALQADGRVVIGGGFNTIGGLPRVGIARLAATTPAIQVLGVTADRSTVMWNRGGSVGEVSSVLFEQSLDRITWTRLGDGTRVSGTPNWQLSGLSLPATGLFYIRARGIAPTTAGTSSGIYESVREFTFASPLPSSAGPVATVPQTGAAPAFDALTGIAPRAAISVVPGEGSVEIFIAASAPPPANPRPARLANLSTRGRVAADSPLILGFAIAGTDSRRVLVRAVGPALNSFGVNGALTTTRLQVYDVTGTVRAMNEGWGNSSETAQTAALSGAFPLVAGSADSAVVLTLTPGNYTMQVSAGAGTATEGVALAEIYDADTGAGSRLVNVSSRGAAGTGANALISGFVIAGDASERVLLRGVGPGLAKFGATGVVADPTVALYNAEGRELGSNDNWVSSVSTISSAAIAAGAFPLDVGSRDAAVLAHLPAGAYTIHVTAPTAGAALLEIYEVR